MGKPRRTIPQGQQSLVDSLSELQRILDGGVEFGSPQDPTDATSTTRATGGANGHNGTVLNMRGSYVDLTVEATGRTTHTCTHNMGVQSSGANVNVRWLVFGIMHDGTGADATTEYRLTVFWMGGAVTDDSIVLGVSLATAGTAPTINADHPVIVTLWFHPAVR